MPITALGVVGPPGPPGNDGAGVPPGGVVGQVLTKTSDLDNATGWQTPAPAGVTSVNSQTGAVTLTKADIGLGSVDNTSDTAKPVSTATQTALNAKADASALTAHTGNTSNPHAVTKTQVGLGSVPNVDATNRANHTGTQSADTLTDGTTNKAFLATERTKLAGIAAGAQVNAVTSVAAKTGAVTLVKSDVGLGSVDNTSDLAKPVSTAQQTALDAKAPLASPALTGTPTAPTAAPGTNTTQLATTAFVLANGGSSSPLTTKGDLYGRSASADTRVPVGADGQVLVADSSQPLGVKWSLRRPILPVAGTHRPSTMSTLGRWADDNTMNLTANKLWLFPLIIDEQKLYTNIACGVFTPSASGSVRLGIYAPTPAVLTPTLLQDCGVVATTVQAFKNISGLTINYPPGCYLVAMLADQDFKPHGIAPVFGWSEGGTNTTIYPQLTASQAYGPLPANPTVAFDKTQGNRLPGIAFY